MRIVASSLRVALLGLLSSSALLGAACSSSDDGAASGPSGGAGAAGATGVGGGASGSTSSAGGHSSGASGAAGVSGHSGQAGQSGQSGHGGESGGHGGAVGAGGSAGTGGVSVGGKGGSSGGGMCGKDADCASALPATKPPGCARAACSPTSKQCEILTVDADKDGHAASHCQALDGTPIVVGDDCDDADPASFPGAWDGPSGDGHPDHCDGIDQSCNGTADDDKLKDGTSCLCAAGDVQSCSTTAGGQPITYPKLDKSGNPLGVCKLGKSTCGSDGKPGPCIGAVGPSVEICNAVDDDCDGATDMADVDTPPLGQVSWYFDADKDGWLPGADANAMRLSYCPGTPPTTCPASLPGCDPKGWEDEQAPTGVNDCDDANPLVNPAAKEVCNKTDDDCNGVVDDNALDAKTWFWDYDGDNYGDQTVTPVKSCQTPSIVPAACTSGLMSVPADYCLGGPTVEPAPVCPPPACDVSMWKQAIPNSDCRDNPGEPGPGSPKGNNPSLVYPGATDFCTGLDYNCQNSPSVGCGCNPVGKTDDCGDAATCNVGKKTCQTGGVYGACSGGDAVTRADFCQDDDKDGFCTSNCLNSACPADVPADGHVYVHKSQCQSQPDCDDTSASINPAVFHEVCNGDGKDHDCNSIVNTPGSGDCECTTSATPIACADPSVTYPSGYTPPMPIPGVCAWGSRTCGALGVYSACTGGVGKAAVENCGQTTKDGMDYDCNGVPNTVQCQCSPGVTTPCGSCGQGASTCKPDGTPGSCIGDPGPQAYCPDKDLDGYCVTSACVQKCANAPDIGSYKTQSACMGNPADCDDTKAAVHPSAMELCGDGVDGNCTSGDNDGYDVGAACSAGAVGSSCYQTGTKVCASPGATTTVCNASAAAPSQSYISTPRNGSFDNNCDNFLDYAAPGGTISATKAGNAAWCANPMGYGSAICIGCGNQYGYVVLACNTKTVTPSDILPGSYHFFDASSNSVVPKCGSTLGMWFCDDTCQPLQYITQTQTCR